MEDFPNIEFIALPAERGGALRCDHLQPDHCMWIAISPDDIAAHFLNDPTYVPSEFVVSGADQDEVESRIASLLHALIQVKPENPSDHLYITMRAREWNDAFVENDDSVSVRVSVTRSPVEMRLAV